MKELNLNLENIKDTRLKKAQIKYAMR